MRPKKSVAAWEEKEERVRWEAMERTREETRLVGDIDFGSRLLVSKRERGRVSRRVLGRKGTLDSLLEHGMISLLNRISGLMFSKDLGLDL